MMHSSNRGLTLGALVALGTVLSGPSALGQQAASNPVLAPQAPSTAAGELRKPLSEKILVLRAPDLFGTTIKVDRGSGTLVDSLTAAGLEQAVAGSVPATILAVKAQHDLRVGYALAWGSLGVALASLVASSVVLLSELPALSSSNSATQGAASRTVQTVDIVALGVEVLALGVSIAGGILVNVGTRAEFDAVGSYNRDLLDGRVSPVP